jgi:hypothetical protein
MISPTTGLQVVLSGEVDHCLKVLMWGISHYLASCPGDVARADRVEAYGECRLDLLRCLVAEHTNRIDVPEQHLVRACIRPGLPHIHRKIQVDDIAVQCCDG